MFDDYEKPQGVQDLVNFVMNPFFIWISIFFIVVLACILANYVKRKNIKLSNKFFLIIWCFYFASELSKECFQHFCHGYSWLCNLPLQFSALPLYCFLILAIVKNKFWRDVGRLFAGPFLFAIGLFFWIYPKNILTMVTFYEVFQSISWHFSMVFFGLFFIIVYKIYSLKYIKQLFASIFSISVFVLIGAILNWYLQDIPTSYFYCVPRDPVYPGISIFWHSTSPFPIYILVFILSFATVSFCLYFIIVFVGIICSRIYKSLN